MCYHESMKWFTAVCVVLVLFHASSSLAQEATSTTEVRTSACGQIVTPDSYEDDGWWEEDITDCDNPFETQGTIPYEVQANGQLLLPGEHMRFATRQWLYFSAPAVDAEFRLYRKVGEDYYFVPFTNPFTDTEKDQFTSEERKALQSQYFQHIGAKSDYSILQYFFPSYSVFFLGDLQKLHAYADGSALLGAGEYVLLSRYSVKVYPTMQAPLWGLVTTAYAAPVGDWYQTVFTITVADESVAPAATPLGPTFTLDPNYKAARLPTIRRNELALQAAELASSLSQREDAEEAYEYGMKGWDYVSDHYVPTDILMSGYAGTLGSSEKVIGLDCAGLIMWAYNRINAPELAKENNFIKYAGSWQQAYNGQSFPVTKDQLLPGDAIFLSTNGLGTVSHVAMYVGDRVTSDGVPYQVVSAESEEAGIMIYTRSYLNISSFVDVRRPRSAQKELEIRTLSPVNMIVVDPDGVRISYEDYQATPFEQYRGSDMYAYSEMKKGHDGRPEDVVYAPYAKAGTYYILVVPDETAAAGDTFSLEVTVQGQKQMLAQGVVIEDPTQPIGYEFYVEGEESAASRGEEEEVIEVSPDPDSEVVEQEEQHQSSSASATRVSGRSSSGRVLGASIDFNLSILHGVFDGQKTLGGYTWYVRSLALSGVEERVIFNQISPTEVEVLLINADTGNIPLLQIVKDAKLTTL